VSTYRCEFYELPPCRQLPKPLQKPHPPVHFGGESDAALRRAADLGQGWYGFNLDPDGAAERLSRLDQLLASRGRPRSTMSVNITPPWTRPVTRDVIDRFESLGVDQVIVTVLSATRDELLDALDHHSAALGTA